MHSAQYLRLTLLLYLEGIQLAVGDGKLSMCLIQIAVYKLNEMSDDIVNSKSWMGCQEWGHCEV